MLQNRRKEEGKGETVKEEVFIGFTRTDSLSTRTHKPLQIVPLDDFWPNSNINPNPYTKS